MSRGIPSTLVSNPGNVFTAGQGCIVPVVGSGAFTCYDYDDNSVATGTVSGGVADCGTLDIGWYRVHVGSVDTYFTVIAELEIPTPQTSPIGLNCGLFLTDSSNHAMLARLAALAGVNYVRDNIDAQELETNTGEPVFHTSTDSDARIAIYAAENLNILALMSDCPDWAGATRFDFWDDHRQMVEFWTEIAARFAGSVKAYEPFNEPDTIPRLGCEAAAWQQSSYFGLRAGDPTAKIGTVPPTSYIGHELRINHEWLADFAQNWGFSFADWCNYHVYGWHADNPNNEFGYMLPMMQAMRDLSRGLPIAVSEISRWIKFAGVTATIPELRTQSKELPWVIALALYHQARIVQYFSLLQVDEDGSNFGVLTSDLTPRPAYAALATAGKLLADAQCVGKLKSSLFAGDGQGYLFNAYPSDATQRQVILARSWTTDTLTLPSTPAAAFDHTGRALSLSTTYSLTTAPIYLVFAAGTITGSDYDAAPTVPVCGQPAPCPVVMFPVFPDRSKVLAQRSAVKLDSSGAQTFDIHLYNHQDISASGTASIQAPSGWVCSIVEGSSVSLSERDFQILTLSVDCSGGSSGNTIETVIVTIDCGSAGVSRRSIRFMPDPSL